MFVLFYLLNLFLILCTIFSSTSAIYITKDIIKFEKDLSLIDIPSVYNLLHHLNTSNTQTKEIVNSLKQTIDTQQTIISDDQMKINLFNQTIINQQTIISDYQMKINLLNQTIINQQTMIINQQKEINTVTQTISDDYFYWKRKDLGIFEADKPTARNEHTSILYGDQMIVFGGHDGSYLNDVHSFNLITNEWSGDISPNLNQPTARSYHTSILYGDQMIVFGGYDGSSYLNDVHSIRLRK